MEEAVTRIVERQFPELSGGYHLPRFARVIAVADPPAANGICDEFRPRYAVDLEILDVNGEADPALPPMPGVPLPLPNGGGERGFLAFPEEGSMVVVGFAYGLPNKPFILQILPHGQSLPKLPKEDQLWQHSEAVLQRVDGAGNWTRQTDGRIRDQAMEREVEALRTSSATKVAESRSRTTRPSRWAESSGSRRWVRSSCYPADPPAWPPWTIYTRPPGAT